MKICLNCGEKLLDNAKRCPHCGKKDVGWPIVDRTDTIAINQIVSSVPNPKTGTPKWKKTTEIQQQIWNSSKPVQHEVTKERIKRNKSNAIACCPKCGSANIIYQSKRFSLGRAVTGAVCAGTVGAVVGGLTSKSGYCKCLNCGALWKK